METVTGLTLVFQCAAQISVGGAAVAEPFGDWRPVGADVWEARQAASGVVQQVAIEREARPGALRVRHRLANHGLRVVVVTGLQTVTGHVEYSRRPAVVGYLHALNAVHGRAPVTELREMEPSLLLGRVPYTFFEGLVVWQGDDAPALVTGPLTQNLVHRWQQLVWDGDRRVALTTGQDFRGLPGKPLAAGASLESDGVYVQFRAEFEANVAFADYLEALGEENKSRWDLNPLRREHFHAPWNNHLYWEATAADVLDTARHLRRDFSRSVRWMGVDDGYQRAWVQPKLARRPDGERIYDLPTELVWYRNCPGVSFGFAAGLGEDREKYPQGLRRLAQEIRETGLRPMLWLGLEISTRHPLVEAHRDWFQPVRAAEGHHALLDVSVPAVREEIEWVLAGYYGASGWEAIKLDFWSQLFERPDLRFSQGDRTAAEWRRWFFELIRRHLPKDGFISLGCELAMGAPWMAPWVDSYRCSMDMRDGDWENVKRNIRWAMVPILTHGFRQPIGDADSVSLFKGLTVSERTCWADFAHQTGTIVEIAGDPAHWSERDRAWIAAYLDEPRGGERCWVADAGAWRRDGMPRAVSRWRSAVGMRPAELITSLHNWSDETQVAAFRDLTGPVRTHRTWEDLRTSAAGSLDLQTEFLLPPRSSSLLRTV
ncbi:MAG: hypothetical protein ACHQ5A_01085 [Opitutales bacterium]